MAVQRGLESARGAQTRLFSDPMASWFVSPVWRMLLAASRIGATRITVESLYDVIGGKGPRASAIARTRLIDDTLDERASLLEQLVILGAGYDCRAHRLSSLADCRVFEVDHPLTQADKKECLARHGVSAPRVIFVPVDFETDELTAALQEAGYSSESSTLFLWEGVTQYLSGEAVDGTLAAIHTLGRIGDLLVFTYVDEAVIRGDFRDFPEAEKWLRSVSKRGEPWIFGISPEETATYLELRGFELIDDASAAEAGAKYFTRRPRDRGSGLYRVATASIVEPPAR